MKSTMKILLVISGLFLITSFLSADTHSIPVHKFDKQKCDSLELEQRFWAINQLKKLKKKHEIIKP